MADETVAAPAFGLKDGGTRQTYSTGAQKEDSSKTDGKGRYDLLPVTAIRRVAEIYRKGAVKYTRAFPVSNLQALETMIMLCSCHQTGHQKNKHVVTQIYHSMQKECADLVMKYPFVSTILNLLKSREQIQENGSSKIENEKEILIELINLDQILTKENICEININDLLNSDLAQTKQIISSVLKEMSVQSVDKVLDQEALTSTIITQQENLEAVCVPNVTKVLGFWGIIAKVFCEHSHTCKIHQHLILNSNGTYTQYHEGNRNWEKGIPLSRFLDSAKRHLDQYQEGLQDEDHLAQATWNLLGLLHTEEMIHRGLLPEELDDLPNYMPKGADPAKWRKKRG